MEIRPVTGEANEKAFESVLHYCFQGDISESMADIAQAIDACFVRRANGVFNVADDEPTPPGEPIAFAASLLGVAPPPLTPFAEAAKTMSPMALSFYQDNRRAENARMKCELGVTLRYPSYRDGLGALYAEMRAAS